MSHIQDTSKPHYRPAERDDIGHVARLMRPEDRDEIFHAAQVSPFVALYNGMAYSDEVYTIVGSEGQPVAMFGVGKGHFGGGVPWLLGTPDLDGLAMPFLRQNKAVLKKWLDHYQYLENYVWEKNVVHIKWLKWLGFEFEAALPMGKSGERFHRFFMGSRTCAT